MKHAWQLIALLTPVASRTFATSSRPIIRPLCTPRLTPHAPSIMARGLQVRLCISHGHATALTGYTFEFVETASATEVEGKARCSEGRQQRLEGRQGLEGSPCSPSTAGFGSSPVFLQYKCPKCMQEIDSEKNLKTHFENKHPKDVRRCPPRCCPRRPLADLPDRLTRIRRRARSRKHSRTSP